MFDQGLFTVLGDVSGQARQGSPATNIDWLPNWKNARVDAANIQVDASVLRSADAQPKQVHVTLLHRLWLFRHY